MKSQINITGLAPGDISLLAAILVAWLYGFTYHRNKDSKSAIIGGLSALLF